MPTMPRDCPAASGRARQAAQRQDEQDAGDEVEEGCEIGVDIASALLLVHGEHALGDEEAAEDVDRGEDQRDEAEEPGPDRPSPEPARVTPTASSAPTTITEEMALVTDISGVCSAGVTDQTT